MSIVVGLDPSLTGTAVCVFTSGWKEPTLLNCITSGSESGVRGRIERYTYLVKKVEESLTGLAPDLIVLEGYSFGSGDTTIWSAEYGGLLRQLFCRHANKIIEVPPATLKKFVIGKGKGDKDLVRAHAQRRWGVIHDTSDETDAYSLGKLGLCYLDETLCECAAQREVIAKLKAGPVKKAKKKRKAVEA